MSAKRDSSNNYIIITKTNIFRLDLIQGLLENDNLKIRLCVDNLEKARNCYFSILEKFESIKPFEFEKTSSDKEYLKSKEKYLYKINQYEKYFEKKKDFNSNKVVIFLDDFLKEKEIIQYKSISNTNNLSDSDNIGHGKNLHQILNRFNFLIYSDLIYIKSIMRKYSFQDYTKNMKFYLQLFHLLKVLKLGESKTVLFADSKKYKNSFEGLLIRSILSSYGIKYNFVDFKYFATEKNSSFIFPLKFLVFKSKKYIFTKYTLKQIYDQIINDYALNFEILKEADRKAYFEKEFSIDKYKKTDPLEEEIDLDEKEIKDQDICNIRRISQQIKNFRLNKKEHSDKTCNYNNNSFNCLINS